MGKAYIMYGGGEMHTFSLKSLKERHHLEDSVIGGKIILKWILEKKGWRVRMGFTWLTTENGGRLL
jgi:hypothetical protein